MPKLGLSRNRYPSISCSSLFSFSLLSLLQVSGDPTSPTLPFSLILHFDPPSIFPHLTPAAGSPRWGLTVNNEGARRFCSAHAVLRHTGVCPLIVSTHTPNPKAVVTPDLIPAPLPTPRLGWP